MLDINLIKTRYFSVKLTVPTTEIIDNEDKIVEKKIVIEVEPPKIKILKKIMTLSKSKDEETLSEALKLILNKNKTNYIVSDEIIDELDIDQYTTIINGYMNWLENKVKQDPN